jgi:hypothetical protein
MEVFYVKGWELHYNSGVDDKRIRVEGKW